MTDIFLNDHIPPWDWNFRREETIAGVAVSKKAGKILGVIEVEPELGVAFRRGAEDTTEVWAALYLRFSEFPWNDVIYTSIGVSTGLNYARDITELERQRAQGTSDGSHLLHYLAPELILALPERRDVEMVFRFHHRSGAYGLISDADGGAHYATAGLRYRF